MRKKILIAEESDTTRGVAENVLRQQGYEVISVSNGDKALEVLELSKPHLILVDSSMTIKGKRSLFDRLQEGAITAAIPFLLIADESDDSLPYPSEVIVTRPLDPKDLVLKASVLTESSGAKSSGGGPHDDEGIELEDDVLDAALGLDQIDVTDSEILDNSAIAKKKTGKNVEKMIGMEQDHGNGKDEDSGKNKVESTQIGEEESEVGRKGASPKDTSKTGKLEILGDHEQFGLGSEGLLDTSDEYANHDYEWFIKEMKKDVTGGPGKPSPAKPPANAPKQSKPAAQSAQTPATQTKKSSSGKVAESGGVDKFIEDFKKEVEKFSDEPAPAPSKLTRKAVHKAKPEESADDSGGLENVTIDQVEVFTRQFVASLAEKIAEKIANKIDSQKLLSLIKNEIVSKNQKQ